jgi:sugar lactone lactonase YvrE
MYAAPPVIETEIKIHKDGRIFTADYKQGLLLLDPGSGKVDAYFDRPHGERFKGLNDLVFASNGDLYFTDQGESGLHDPTGRLRSCAGIDTTNAAYGGSERKTLYITEGETGTILSALLDVPGKDVYSHM